VPEGLAQSNPASPTSSETDDAPTFCDVWDYNNAKTSWNVRMLSPSGETKVVAGTDEAETYPLRFPGDLWRLPTESGWPAPVAGRELDYVPSLGEAARGVAASCRRDPHHPLSPSIAAIPSPVSVVWRRTGHGMEAFTGREWDPETGTGCLVRCGMNSCSFCE
jgi:hypothetical protein